MTRHVNLENARVDKQRDVMGKIKEDGVCPFCPEHLEAYHEEPILRRGDHWIVTRNQWPYSNTETHLLAIATRHVVALSELTPGAGEELLNHFRWAEDVYKIAAGGLAMRFGDVGRSGATVQHLHAHLIVPQVSVGIDPVRFKIG